MLSFVPTCEVCTIPLWKETKLDKGKEADVPEGAVAIAVISVEPLSTISPALNGHVGVSVYVCSHN